jgi:hypothetical protein
LDSPDDVRNGVNEKETTMRTILTTVIFAALFMVLSAPAMADTRRGDYIDERLDSWISYVEDLDYDVVESEIDSIRSSQSLYYDLEPGTYYAVAEGDNDIQDLDMQVLDERGRELGSDYLEDNYPVVEFTINDYEEVQFNISVYEFSNRSNSGDFCFVLASERNNRDNRRDHGDNGDQDRRDRCHNRDNRDDNNWNNDGNDNWNDDNYWDDNNGNNDYQGDNYDWNDWRDEYNNWDWSYGDDYGHGGHDSGDGRGMVENNLSDLYDFAQSRGHNPIMDDIGQISDIETYSQTLDRGYYVAFAAGDMNISDLDLKINDDNGWNIAQDIDPDASPAVWFYLPDRMTVEIDVEVWSFTDWNDSGYFALLVCER